MKNHLFLSILFLFYLINPSQAQEDFRKQAPAPGPAPRIEMGKYDRFQLANGLEVIVVENHKLPRVSFQLFVDVPPHTEGDLAGVADLAGQMLSRGTTSRSKAEIDESIDFIGASFSTGATGLFASGLTKHQDELLAVLVDVLYKPSFPQEEFDKLKTQILSGLAASKDSPDAIAANVAQVLRFGKQHPYGEIITEESVEKITLDHCRTYYQTYFKPNISYLVIVGDTDVANARKLAEQYFGAWKRGEIARPKYAEPTPPASRQVDFVDKTGAVQSVITITYPVMLRPGAPDAIAASLMNTILGGYFGSRLNENIREDKGYSYGVGSDLDSDETIGYFSAGGSVRNEVTDSAITEFLKEMERMRAEPPSSEELALVKSVRTGAFARALESPQTVASFALNTARYNLPTDYYPAYLEKLNAVTASDIQAVARKYLLPDQAHILVVGNKDEVAGKLAAFAASGEVNLFDHYGEPVQEAAAAAAGMTAAKVIDRYLAAIGGREKLAGVQDLSIIMKATIQGMTLEMNRVQKAGKLAVIVSANGMTMSEQKFDGEKGVVIQGGQRQTLEGDQLQEMALQAKPFPELDYAAGDYQLTLKGTEKINGQDAYRLDIVQPSGNKVTEFFAVDSGFKLRTVQSQEGPAGAITITNDYSDYQAVEGIQFPYTITASGMMPIPLKLEVATIAINKGIEDSVFIVE